eukprot:scaffold32046_cov46-Attheya_sp.AAC.1
MHALWNLLPLLATVRSRLRVPPVGYVLPGSLPPTEPLSRLPYAALACWWHDDTHGGAWCRSAHKVQAGWLRMKTG